MNMLLQKRCEKIDISKSDNVKLIVFIVRYATEPIDINTLYFIITFLEK